MRFSINEYSLAESSRRIHLYIGALRQQSISHSDAILIPRYDAVLMWKQFEAIQNLGTLKELSKVDNLVASALSKCIWYHLLSCLNARLVTDNLYLNIF